MFIKPKYKIIIIILLLSILATSCTTEKGKERTALTEKYGAEIENIYAQYILAREIACQTEDSNELEAFASGEYLEGLKERVETSSCYLSEDVRTVISGISIREYSPSKIEALIITRANGNSYPRIVTFHQEDGSWKIISYVSVRWDD